MLKLATSLDTNATRSSHLPKLDAIVTVRCSSHLHCGPPRPSISAGKCQIFKLGAASAPRGTQHGRPAIPVVCCSLAPRNFLVSGPPARSPRLASPHCTDCSARLTRPLLPQILGTIARSSRRPPNGLPCPARSLESGGDTHMVSFLCLQNHTHARTHAYYPNLSLSKLGLLRFLSYDDHGFTRRTEYTRWIISWARFLSPVV